MIEIKNNFGDIKNSNLVVLVEKTKDLELLESLDLSDKILKKIEKELKKEKNNFLQFFLGNKHFENLYVFIYTDTKKEIEYFLGENIKKIDNNFSLVAKKKRILDLLNAGVLARYKFQKYKTEKKEDKIFVLAEKKDKDLIKDRIKTLENIVLARNLGTEPANYLTPKEFVKLIKNTSLKNTKIKVLDYEKIKELKMGLIEAVGKGSINKPIVVILERIINKEFPTIGIVGKGMTFDTGGIQVKPGDAMYEMKGDMCGAANTFAIMKELDRKNLKVNIIACLVLAENHISGESYKPSDIFTSYSGKTVDIIHTDAEGRLVLADGISYISKNYKLDKLISIATLTGACMVALGFRYAGIMGTDKKLINKFLEYSEENFEKYNKLPFDNYFIEKTKSEVADLENLNRGIYAGSTMAAAFLSNFLMNKEKYTHIDIAGTALNSYEAYGLANKGMTGFGVDSISSIIEKLD